MMPQAVRRRRPPTSCLTCRQRKVRCNQSKPCNNCIRNNNGHGCVYDAPHPAAGGAAARKAPDDARRREPISGVKAIAETDRGLAPVLPEKATVPSSTSTPGSNLETMSSRLGGTFHIQCEDSTPDQRGTIARSATSKARLFGPSHWALPIMMLVRDVLDTVDADGEGAVAAWLGIEKCKTLARSIKAQRQPPWPSPPTSELPSKDVTDSLVDCYVSTCESMYRILHVPIFRARYEALWEPGAMPDTAFLVQVKLVLALGAITHDDKFLLRSSAVKWIREAQAWASEPKLGLDIQSLQTDLLLLLAQERLNVSGNLMWISVGAMVRKAVYMGLHRDPSYIPRGSTLDDEMHRRVWNTILEVAVQSSLACGGPPFLSLNDFDTAPPRNFDDESLLAGDTMPAPDDRYTCMSVPIALRKTFAARLSMVTFLNSLGSPNTYEETNRLDRELRAAYKKLKLSLQSCGGTVSSPGPSNFDIYALEILTHRYLSTLHAPYFSASLHDSKYAYSRQVVVESSLKIWQAIHSLQYDDGLIPDEHGQTLPRPCMLRRLVICSSGFFPTTCMQAAVFIAMELRAQLRQQDMNLGPIRLRPDLLSVLDEAEPFSLGVLSAGETNVKGYLLMSIITTQVRGLIAGVPQEELAKAMVVAAERVSTTCLPILQDMLQKDSCKQDDTTNDYSNIAPAMPMEDMGEMGYSLSDALFGSFDMEPLAWMFSNTDD